MAPILIILFIGLPLLELYVLLEVGGVIGALPTITIVVVDGIIGAMLASSQGRAAWQRLNEALAERRVPGREAFDGALILFGGALLLTPGFITDAAGLILLIPPTRALVRRGAAGFVARRAKLGAPLFVWRRVRPSGDEGPRPASEYPPPGGFPRRPAPDYDVEGTAQEVTDAGLPQPEQPRPRREPPPHPDGPGAE